MHIKRLPIVLGLTLGLALLTWSLLALTSQAGRAAPACDRYVVNGGNNSSENHCNDPNNPCKSVQYALVWASAGERICVADRDDTAGASTYYGTIIITRSVTLDGAWAAHPSPLGGGWTFASVPCAPQNVVLSGNGSVRVISITNSSPTITCFTITNGNAGGAADGPNHGGGIAAQEATPIIVGNIITGNYGCTTVACPGDGRGGGVYLINAPATAVISGNLIANNVADDTGVGWGGGIYLENASPHVLSNTIQGNRAGGSTGNGGGIAVISGSPTLADNRVLSNIGGRSVMAHGGGIFIDSDTVVTVEHNLIQGNIALTGTASAGLFSRGGGIFYDGSLAIIRENEVYGNIATLNSERGLGGGMYLHGLSAAAEVRGNMVAHDNRASYVADGSGGGIYLDNCYATVAENQVFDNTASSGPPAHGGGIYVNGGGGLIQGNVITHNYSVIWTTGEWVYGGGMVVSGSVVLVQDNLIAYNEATYGTNSRGVGGGVYVWGGKPRFTGNQILSNTTGDGGAAIGYGGGFALGGASPWLEGNTIMGNHAIGADEGYGGGVYIGSCHYFTLTNNIIARNVVSAAGSGVSIVGSGASRGQMAHNTIAANLTGDGVGVYVGLASTVLLYNNIIVSQTVGITNAAPGGSVVSATHTLFEANGLNYGSSVTSTNEVPGPAMLLPNYHLAPGSNAINHAVPLAWVTRDIDGDPRPLGSAPDIGADEARFVYLPLVLRNY